MFRWIRELISRREVKPNHRNFSSQDIQLLEEAHGAMWYLAERDCDCDFMDGVPTDDRTSCDVCQARRAIRRLDAILEPRWESSTPSRMTNLPERVFVEKWRKENNRVNGFNGGRGALEILLARKWRRSFVGLAEPIVQHVSQRDMEVATTVIQWLGTNCGSCFLQQCEDEIAKQSGVQRRFGTNGLSYPKPDATTSEIADQIAANFISVDVNPEACKSLSHAIQVGFQQYMKSKLEKLPATVGR